MNLFNRKKVEIPEVEISDDKAVLHPHENTQFAVEDNPPPSESSRTAKIIELPKTTWAI